MCTTKTTCSLQHSICHFTVSFTSKNGAFPISGGIFLKKTAHIYPKYKYKEPCQVHLPVGCHFRRRILKSQIPYCTKLYRVEKPVRRLNKGENVLWYILQDVMKHTQSGEHPEDTPAGGPIGLGFFPRCQPWKLIFQLGALEKLLRSCMVLIVV